MGAAEKIEGLVVLTPEQLTAIVRKAVSEALVEHDANAGARLLTVEEAAGQLGITANALHKRIARGLITPDVKGGSGAGARGHRFAQATLDAYKRGGGKA